MLSANACKPGTVYFSHKTIHNEAFNTKCYTYGITHSPWGQSHYLVASVAGFGFLAQNFGKVVGTYECSLLFCEADGVVVLLLCAILILCAFAPAFTPCLLFVPAPAPFAPLHQPLYPFIPLNQISFPSHQPPRPSCLCTICRVE